MDFFSSQDQARGRTKQLIALYFVAMVAIIISIYAVFVFAGFGQAIYQSTQGGAPPPESTPIRWFNPELFAAVAIGVIAVIAGASIFKIKSLGQGGAAVAKSVGGRALDQSTTDPDERKLLNIVEEMSIASGVPMPDVFVLQDEDGINAFAAGYDYNDAAIAVTKGAIQQLSRDELQGVVAHEFSHVLSGDMRLNIRLIGPLFGLLVIAFLGRMFLYSGAGRSRGKNQGNLAIVGIAIMVIGYIGVIFGRLIQAAISRQREYLADASAVQFTRNPEGIADALRRLGYGANGSKVQHAHAEDTAHMFFAKALSSSFATHPPLPKRIKAVLPNWDGSFLPPRKERTTASDEKKATGGGQKSRGQGMMDAITAVAAVGALSQDSVRQGIEQRIRIRRCLGDLSLDSPAAVKITFIALILDPENDFPKQIEWLESQTDAELASSVRERVEAMAQLSASERFAVMELCHPGLRKFSSSEREEFVNLLEKTAHRDGKISLREALVLHVVHRQFDEKGAAKSRGKSLTNNAGKFAEPISQLLFLVASMEAGDEESAKTIFADSIEKQYLLSGSIQLPTDMVPLSELSGILTQLEGASFGIRKQILSAAAHIVLSDEKTTDREWTFLRLVSLSLGAPMPPLAEE